MNQVINYHGKLGHERMTIKTVPDAHAFVNRRYDNDWNVYGGDLKSGTYAKAGGRWVNVKTLDPSLLAHI
jgi:hypothetical protein